MNSVGSKNLSLKHKWPTLLGCTDIGIRKLEFVAKTQFLLVIEHTSSQFQSLNLTFFFYHVLQGPLLKKTQHPLGA